MTQLQKYGRIDKRLWGGDGCKSKRWAMRQAYTVRLKPELLKALKHLAVDENKTIGELIEEGIAL
jgi:hypothetical protein